MIHWPPHPETLRPLPRHMWSLGASSSVCPVPDSLVGTKGLKFGDPRGQWGLSWGEKQGPSWAWNTEVCTVRLAGWVPPFTPATPQRSLPWGHWSIEWRSPGLGVGSQGGAEPRAGWWHLWGRPSPLAPCLSLPRQPTLPILVGVPPGVLQAVSVSGALLTAPRGVPAQVRPRPAPCTHQAFLCAATGGPGQPCAPPPRPLTRAQELPAAPASGPTPTSPRQYPSLLRPPKVLGSLTSRGACSLQDLCGAEVMRGPPPGESPGGRVRVRPFLSAGCLFNNKQNSS